MGFEIPWRGKSKAPAQPAHSKSSAFAASQLLMYHQIKFDKK